MVRWQRQGQLLQCCTVGWQAVEQVRPKEMKCDHQPTEVEMASLLPTHYSEASSAHPMMLVAQLLVGVCGLALMECKICLW